MFQSIQQVGADLVFDIGANSGQFARDLRSNGFEGKIVSFEPLSIAHQSLTENAAGDPDWHIHPRGAVGDFDGEIDINIAGNSFSSSILPMLDSHAIAAAGSAYVGAERAPISRLDSVARAYLGDRRYRYIVKIDTQGFEWQVFDGAAETLRNAQGVICELSLVPLYEGQRLWRDIVDRLEGEGFTLWALLRGFTDSRNGRSMQVDAVFLRLDDDATPPGRSA